MCRFLVLKYVSSDVGLQKWVYGYWQKLHSSIRKRKSKLSMFNKGNVFANGIDLVRAGFEPPVLVMVNVLTIRLSRL